MANKKVSITVSLLDKFTKTAKAFVASQTAMANAAKSLQTKLGNTKLGSAAFKQANAAAGNLKNTLQGLGSMGSSQFNKMGLAARVFSRHVATANRSTSSLKKRFDGILNTQIYRGAADMAHRGRDMVGKLAPTETLSALQNPGDRIMELNTLRIEAQRALDMPKEVLAKFFTEVENVAHKTSSKLTDSYNAAIILGKAGADEKTLMAKDKSGTSYMQRFSSFMNADNITGAQVDEAAGHIEAIRSVMGLSQEQLTRIMDNMAGIADDTSATQMQMINIMGRSVSTFKTAGISLEDGVTAAGIGKVAKLQDNEVIRAIATPISTIGKFGRGEGSKSQKKILAKYGIDANTINDSAAENGTLATVFGVIGKIKESNAKLGKRGTLSAIGDIGAVFGSHYDKKLIAMYEAYESRKDIGKKVRSGAYRGKVSTEQSVYNESVQAKSNQIQTKLDTLLIKHTDVIVGVLDGLSTFVDALTGFADLFTGMDKRAAGQYLALGAGLLSVVGILATTIAAIFQFKLAIVPLTGVINGFKAGLNLLMRKNGVNTTSGGGAMAAGATGLLTAGLVRDITMGIQDTYKPKANDGKDLFGDVANFGNIGSLLSNILPAAGDTIRELAIIATSTVKDAVTNLVSGFQTGVSGFLSSGSNMAQAIVSVNQQLWSTFVNHLTIGWQTFIGFFNGNQPRLGVNTTAFDNAIQRINAALNALPKEVKIAIKTIETKSFGSALPYGGQPMVPGRPVNFGTNM
jgi:TP901 family phage tail tape measure protein